MHNTQYWSNLLICARYAPNTKITKTNSPHHWQQQRPTSKHKHDDYNYETIHRIHESWHILNAPETQTRMILCEKHTIGLMFRSAPHVRKTQTSTNTLHRIIDNNTDPRRNTNTPTTTTKPHIEYHNLAAVQMLLKHIHGNDRMRKTQSWSNVSICDRYAPSRTHDNELDTYYGTLASQCKNKTSLCCSRATITDNDSQLRNNINE